MAEPEFAESGTEDEARVEDEHLADVKDGSGCIEIWEHLTENRSDD